MDQIVTVVSDILLGAGALGAAVYCGVLAQRLKRFNNLENGVGGAVALLTALTERAESASRKLELMLAALNDLPDAAPAPNPRSAAKSVPEPTPTPAPPEAISESEQDAAWVAAAASTPAAASNPAAAPEAPTEAAPVFLSRRARAAGDAA